AAEQGEFDEQRRQLAALLESSGASGTSAGDTAGQLLAICREVVKDREIGADDNLFEAELSSLDLAQIFEEIEQRFPVELEITDLFDYPTVNELARYLDEQGADAPA
ncbi:MAG: acyl carrier protein, partial [Wenzhouxiangellaceae bacterium]